MTAKKKTKKTSPKTSRQEVIVRIEAPTNVKESDLEPMKDGGHYMIPKTWLSEKQVMKMIQRTPSKHIYTRPGKGGQVWSYVTGNYVEKVLNYTFGWNWDFEIVQHGKEGEQVWVQGKLTVKDDKGHQITKSQFGRADIKFKKDSKIMLDFGNDLKSASTDALKKCASLLGIASDIYGKAEFKQEAGMEVQPDKSLPPAPSHNQSSSSVKNEENEDYVCMNKGCGNDITKAEAEYSKKLYGKPLCRNCQKLAAENKKK